MSDIKHKLLINEKQAHKKHGLQDPSIDRTRCPTPNSFEVSHVASSDSWPIFHLFGTMMI